MQFLILNYKFQKIDLIWFFLMSKFVYIFESVILALRNDTSIMRDYLIIHHVMIPLAIWNVINFYPTGHATFAALIMSLAHVVLFGFKLFSGVLCLKEFKLYRYGSLVGLASVVS